MKSAKDTVHVILCSGHSGSRFLVRLLIGNGIYMGTRRGQVGEDNQDFGSLLWNDGFRRQLVAHWKYPDDPRLVEPIHIRLMAAHDKFMGGMKASDVAAGTKNATLFPYVAEHYRAAIAGQGKRIRFIHLTRNPLTWMLSGRDPDSRGIVRPARHPRFSIFSDAFNRYVWFGELNDTVATPIGRIQLSDLRAYSEDEQIALEARLWTSTNSIAEKFKHFSEDYLHLRYEDLIRKPEETVSELSAFMGVPLRYDAAGVPGIRSDRVEFDPVRKLGEGRVTIVRNTCGDLMDRFGYRKNAAITSQHKSAAFINDKSRFPQLPGITGLRPIFVVGCMRSGTTILGKLLDMHPCLKQIGWELNDEWSTLGQAPCGIVCEHRESRNATREAAKAMAGFLREKLGRNAQDVRPVNKSPHLGNKIAYVRALFPDAQFIHIVRDPFSHSNSMYYHFMRVTREQRNSVAYWPDDDLMPCWQQYTMEEAQRLKMEYDRIFPGGGFARIPEAWVKMNDYIVRSLENLPAGSAMSLSYNRLVLNPECEMARLFSFLDLDKRPSRRVINELSHGVGLVNSQTRDPLHEWRSTLAHDRLDIIQEELDRCPEAVCRIESALNTGYAEKYHLNFGTWIESAPNERGKRECQL